MEIYNIRIVGKRDQKFRYCRTDIADHHTGHNQDGHIPYSFCCKNHKEGGSKGSEKGCKNHGKGSKAVAIPKGSDH